MKRFATAVVLLTACWTMAAEGPLADLEGNYNAIAITRDGKDEPADVVKTASVKIASDELAFTVKGKTFRAKITVDSRTKPATFDIAPSDGSEKGRTFPGIYKVENGELVIAFTERGERPATFKGEDGVLLVRLKKDAKK